MRTFWTLRKGFHGTHDRNVNLHIRGMPPSAEANKHEDPTLWGPYKLNEHLRQTMPKPNLRASQMGTLESKTLTFWPLIATGLGLTCSSLCHLSTELALETLRAFIPLLCRISLWTASVCVLYVNPHGYLIGLVYLRRFHSINLALWKGTNVFKSVTLVATLLAHDIYF